jgi:hypothetical protein
MARKTIQVSPELHGLLTSLAQTRKISINDIMGYLTDLLEKYDMLDPDWLEPLLEERMSEYMARHDTDLAKKLQMERTKTINKAKYFSFQEYVKLLDPEDRKAFLVNVLGDVNDESFLDNISNYQMFSIDGTPRLYQVDPEGKPVVIDKQNLVSCMMGYHFIGNFCKCNKWRTCPIRKEEYLGYLSKVDPNMRSERTRRFTDSYQRNQLPDKRRNKYL